MSALRFQRREARARIGLKGPRAAPWLAEQGIALPPKPNTWSECVRPGLLLVARLGAGEFFLEEGGTGCAGAACAGAADRDAADAVVRHLSSAVQSGLPGIYPVLREDAAFLLSGEGALAVLAQVCNVDFAALDLLGRPIIMTLLIGVSVLIVPRAVEGTAQYRIWCDPTFGPYLDEAVGKVVIDCGGSHTGVSS